MATTVSDRSIPDMDRVAASAVEAVIVEIAPQLDSRITTKASVLDAHGHDESWHYSARPDAVCFPETTEEVAAIVRACDAHVVPVIAYGVGTSLEGHVMAERGGICIDLSHMNAVIEIRPEDMDATVQAGITRTQLNSWLHDTGLFFSVDPGADATLGGMASTRASGTNTVRYGTMRDNVVSLTAVMADGEVVRTARRPRKSAAGYDLTHLLVGAEGTLGVITELTVGLHGQPEAVSAAVVSFKRIADAVNAVIASIQYGIPMARIELLDGLSMQAVNRFSNLDYAEKPTLFLEFHGTPAGVREQAESFADLCREHNGSDFTWATAEEERKRLWSARHEAAYAAKQLRPGMQFHATDVCVPISRLAETIQATRDDVEKTGLTAPLLGHVGDGNFHLVIIIDRDAPDEMAALEAFNERLVARALAVDGTCTGEHGIGMGKRRYMADEHGNGMAVMRAIKTALDPKDILNPGKIV